MAIDPQRRQTLLANFYRHQPLAEATRVAKSKEAETEGVSPELTAERFAALAVLATIGQVNAHNSIVLGKADMQAVTTTAIVAVVSMLDDDGVIEWLASIGSRAKGGGTYARIARRPGRSHDQLVEKLTAIDFLFSWTLLRRMTVRREFRSTLPQAVTWISNYLESWQSKTFDAGRTEQLVSSLRVLRSQVNTAEIKRLLDMTLRETVSAPDGSPAQPGVPVAAEPAKSSREEEHGPALSAFQRQMVSQGRKASDSIDAVTDFYQSILRKDVGTLAAQMSRRTPLYDAAREAFTKITGLPIRPDMPDADLPGHLHAWAANHAAGYTPDMDVAIQAAVGKSEPAVPSVAVNIASDDPALGLMSKYSVDAEKARIIHTEARRVIVPAAAGSGKTRVVTTKIKHLVQEKQVPPSEVRIVAFNAHAAEELRNRLGKMIGPHEAADVAPMTTHSFASRHLSSIGSWYKEGLDATAKPDAKANFFGNWLPSQMELIQRAFDSAVHRLDIKPFTDFAINLTVAKAFAARYKNEGLTLTEYLESMWDQRDDPRVRFLSLVTLLYEEQKGMLARERDRYKERFSKVYDFFMVPPADGAGVQSWARHVDESLVGGRLRVRFDFDDWVNEAHQSITVKDFDDDRSKADKQARLEQLASFNRYLIVDEAQDLSPAQVSMFGAIGALGKQYIQVGDDAQSIFGFRGANPEDFVRQSGESDTQMMTLSTNYRSNEEIVQAADRLINRNTVTIKKSTKSARGAGGSVNAQVGQTYEEIASHIALRIRNGLQSPDGEARYLDEEGRPRYAILCRTRRELDEFEDELAIQGIDYVRKGGRPFWLKSDVGAVIALMALAYQRASLINIPAKEQLAYLGRAMAYPHRPGSASGGEAIYMEPMKSASDPLAAMKNVQRHADARYVTKTGKVIEAGDQFRALSADIDRIAAAAPDLNAMFEAMLSGTSTGHNGETLAQVLVAATAANMDADEMSVEDATGADSPTSGKAGVSVFGKLLRFAKINDLEGDAQSLIRRLMATTERAAQNQQQNPGRRTRFGRAKQTDGATPEAVVLSTVHMTKGLEYENVFVVANESTFPSPVFPNDDLLTNPKRLSAYGNSLEALKTEEERRLMYTAMTRAVSRLDIYATMQTPSGKDTSPSRFIEEAGISIVPLTDGAGVSEGVYYVGPISAYAAAIVEDYRRRMNERSAHV